MVTILFACLENTARSQMAAALFNHKARLSITQSVAFDCV